MANVELPYFRWVGLAISSIPATGNPVVTAGGELAPNDRTTAGTRARAEQSSWLYVRSRVFVTASPVSSQACRQTIDWRPEASAADHRNPRHPATLFRSFAWVGK